MREPTEYEKELMRLLEFKDLRQLKEFLAKPSWGCHDMETPELPEEPEDETELTV